MTLAQDIVSDATAVFLDTDDFAETWVMYPKGKIEDKTTVTLVPHLDGLDGTREVPGDGRVLNLERSRSVRLSGILSLPATITITEAPEREVDVFQAPGGRVWTVKRVLGEDAGMQDVLVVRREGDLTYRGQRRG